MEQYENNSYNNYSILSTNLTNGTNKFKKVYRMSSPVLIQSYGKNNFVVELKYKSNKNNNDDYEFIEKELKKNKKNNKAYTTYTEISNEESLFFGAQKPNQRYYKDFTNYANYSPDNITTSNNDNNNYDQNYNYQINDNEDIDILAHPNDRIYIPKKNSNRINKNINDLKYQRFCASFISKNPSSNKNSRKKKIYHKTENYNNINYISNNIKPDEKKERQISKTKNQLQDFNIDKLKEIGDNFALRYMNKRSQLNKNNLQNKQNSNNVNNVTILSEKKEKHNGIINKIIMFDKKRRESKNKFKLINKTEIKKRSEDERINNDILKNKNIYEIKKINDTNNCNHLSTRTKILNMNKNDVKLMNCPSPYTKKIRLNNLIRRKKFTFIPEINPKFKEEFKANYITIKNRNSNNLESKDSTKIDLNKNKDYSQYNTKNSNFSYYSNNNNNISSNINNNKGERTNKIYKKVQNVNSRIIMDKNKNHDILKNKNINHNYFESINIKNNNKIKKTEHSFNNVFFPLK